MSVALETTAFDRGTDPVLGLLSREQAESLVAYRGSEAIQARIEELACKNTEGELTEEERAEYEGYVQANFFIATLQAKVRHFLSRS